MTLRFPAARTGRYASRHLAPRPAAGPLARAAAVLLAAAAMTALAACSAPDDRKQAHMARAQAHAAAGAHDKAVVELKNVLRIDPGDSAARFMLGRSHERLGELGPAAAQYARVMEDDPSHAPARRRLGMIHLLAGQPERAVELADEALALAPGSAAALALRGAAHLKRGELERARADAAAALAADPLDLEALRLAAALAAREGDLARAVTLLESGIARHPQDQGLRLAHRGYLDRSGQHDRAVAAMRAHIDALPPAQQPRRRLALALYLDRLERRDEAEAALREAVRLHPQEPAMRVALAQFLANRRDPRAAEQLLFSAAAESASPAPYQLALAQLYEQTGQAEKVEALYERMIAEHGVEAPGLAARTALAARRARAGRLDDAGRLVEETLAENPADRAALTLRAKLALARGDPLRAIGDLRTVVRDHPDDVEALWLLGVSHQRNREPDAAEDVLRRALRAGPDALAPRLGLARLLARRGQRAGALAVVEEGLARDPQSGPLLTALAELQVGGQDWDATAETARLLERAYPEHGLGPYLAGGAAFGRGEYAAAARELERAATRDPDNPAVLADLLRARLAEGKGEAALERVAAAARRHPGSPALAVVHGRSLRALGRLDEARAAFERAVALAPGAPAVHLQLAGTLAAAGEHRAAQAALEAALEPTGEALPVVVELAHSYDASGRHADAIALYERYLGAHPGSALAANNLAMLLATRRSDPTSLERAAALAEPLAASESPLVLDTLGWVYHRRGDTARAVSVLEDVIARSPDVPTYQFHLGAALIADGQLERGRAHLDRALRAAAPFPEREEALALREALSGR